MACLKDLNEYFLAIVFCERNVLLRNAPSKIWSTGPILSLANSHVNSQNFEEKKRKDSKTLGSTWTYFYMVETCCLGFSLLLLYVLRKENVR